MDGGRAHAPLILDGFPGKQVTPPVPTGLAFYDTLGQDLAATPPSAADACALQAFASVGIGPGQTPSTGTDPLVTQALAAAATAGPRLVTPPRRLCAATANAATTAGPCSPATPAVSAPITPVAP